MKLSFTNIHASFGKKEVLKGINLDVEEGKITGIIGPNGCGKSTLIKTIFDIVPKTQGRILLNGTDTATMSRKETAALIGYVGQDSNCVFDFSVRDIVGMALYSKKNMDRPSNEIVMSALMELGIEDFADRSIKTLSGGERKMVFLARAIAQGADTIVLDEPTNHLDIKHQLFIMNYLKKTGKTVLIVLHDLRLASYYCDVLYLIKNGYVVKHGKPEEILSPETVDKVFEIVGNIYTREDGTLDFRLQMGNDI